MVFFLRLDNLKAVSTNSLYKGMGKRRRKTVAYKYLEQVVKFEVLKNQKAAKEFLSSFNGKKDCIRVKVYSELSNLIIRKSKDKDRVGHISMTSLDVDNSFKALIDSVFKQIGINDAEICAIEGYKFQSNHKSNNIFIELENINRDILWNHLKAHLRESIQIKQ